MVLLVLFHTALCKFYSCGIKNCEGMNTPKCSYTFKYKEKGSTVYEIIVKFWLRLLQNYEQPVRPGAILHCSFTNHINL